MDPLQLECLISSLLAVGRDLERQCPDKVASLKDQIRDAFVLAQEPWTRKVAAPLDATRLVYLK